MTTTTLEAQGQAKSSNVLLMYVIKRKKCGLYCIGETEQILNERMNNSEVIYTKDKPVTIHLNSLRHSIMLWNDPKSNRAG